MKTYFRLTLLAAGLLASVLLFDRSRLLTLQGERNRLRAEYVRPAVPHQRAARAEQADPGRDFPLLGSMDADERWEKIDAIVSGAGHRPGQRATLIAALRAYLQGVVDPRLAEEIRSATFEALARDLDSESTESTFTWLAETTVIEKVAFAEGLDYASTGEATGRWIDWMATNLEPGQLAGPVAALMEEWTREDYQAAGNWLAAVTESSVRQVAVQTYIEAVASHDPHAAIQWAMTLPEGSGRDAGLSAVHANWPADDPDGKAAFQREHNME